MSFKIGDVFVIDNDRNAVFANVAANSALANSTMVMLPAGMGIVYGFVSAWSSTDSTPAWTPNTGIDRFSMVSSDNASDHGDLTVARTVGMGVSSATHGYVLGGAPSNSSNSNVIDKFAMVSAASATDVGDLHAATRDGAGTSSPTSGFYIGGFTTVEVQTIGHMHLASDQNGEDTTTLIGFSLAALAGISSDTQSFNAGGLSSPASFDVSGHTARFPFANWASTSTIGSLTEDRGRVGGLSSTTHGYVVGGTEVFSSSSNIIDKFSFSSTASAVDVGNLAVSGSRYTGLSSSHTAWIAGGTLNMLQRFSFASEGNATDSGRDMTSIMEAGCTQAY